MFLVRSKRRVLRVLDQVIALRGERALNVWTSGSLVSCDKAISHHQLACAVGSTIPDTAATLITSIAIDGAKDHLHLSTGNSVKDATTRPLRHVIRNRAIDEGECPSIVGDATPGVCQITGDRAANESERPYGSIVDAATA